MKAILATLVLLLSLHATLHACLNEKEGTEEVEVPIALHFAPRDLKADAPVIRKEANKLLESLQFSYDSNFKLRYSVQLIRLGEYAKAEKVLLEMTTEVPTRSWYGVAANLGTLYELMGNNEKAYKEIARAIKINPNAHHGSEWIHLNILDIKRTKGKPANSQNLIGTDFGQGVAPLTTLPNENLEALSQHVRWQLHERMNFVHPEDSIVARLLFDLANMDLLLGRYELALENYEWARKYGMAGELLDERVAYVNDAEDNARKAAEIDARAKAETEKLKLEPRRTPEQEAAFWEQIGALSFPVVALLSIGIYFGIQRLRKKK